MITALKKRPAHNGLMPLAAVPEYQAAVAEYEALAERSRQTDGRRAAAKARLQGKPSKRPFKDRAADLLKGGISPAGDPRDEIAACDEEDRILGPALMEARSKIDEAASALGFAANKEMAARHYDALRAVYLAGTALADAIREIKLIQNDLTAAGYSPRYDILPARLPLPAIQLGAPELWNTPLAAFGRHLRDDLGISL